MLGKAQTLAGVALASLAPLVSHQSDFGNPTQSPNPSELLPLPKRTVDYVSFNGVKRRLYPWRGRRVAMLTPERDLDRRVMTRLIHAFDAVHGFYALATGREPQLTRHVDGLMTIAVESDTCGAGCGYLGATGIELTPESFELLCRGLRSAGEIDQVLPYEFGRNFWFYGDQLAFHGEDESDAFTTGYAVLMRF